MSGRISEQRLSIISRSFPRNLSPRRRGAGTRFFATASECAAPGSSRSRGRADVRLSAHLLPLRAASVTRRDNLGLAAVFRDSGSLIVSDRVQAAARESATCRWPLALQVNEPPISYRPGKRCRAESIGKIIPSDFPSEMQMREVTFEPKKTQVLYCQPAQRPEPLLCLRLRPTSQ